MLIGQPDDEWTPHWQRSFGDGRANAISETLQAVQKTIQETSRSMSGDIAGAARKDLAAIGAVKDLAAMGAVTSAVSDILAAQWSNADVLGVSGAVATAETFGSSNTVTAMSGSIQAAVEAMGAPSIAQRELLANVGGAFAVDKYALAQAGLSLPHKHLLGEGESGADQVSGEIKRIEAQLPKLKTDTTLANVYGSMDITSTIEKITADMGAMSHAQLTDQLLASAGVMSAVATIEGGMSVAGLSRMGIPSGTIGLAYQGLYKGEMLEKIAESIVSDSLVIRETPSHQLLVVERVTKRWKESRLWFLIRLLPEEDVYLLDDLEPEKMEEVLDEALEKVVTDGTYTQMLISALDNPPYISDLQRNDLLHGLAHAERGEFNDALLPLLNAIEGAFWCTGEQEGIIDQQRRMLTGPIGREAKSVEMVFKALSTGEGFATFLKYRVFGGRGNHARHGRQSFPRRKHVLCLVVALAGWMDEFMDLPTREVLGQMLRDALSSEM